MVIAAMIFNMRMALAVHTDRRRKCTCSICHVRALRPVVVEGDGTVRQ
jgi:hypothetical protein